MSEKNSINPLLASVLLEAKNLSHNFDYELFKNINLSLKVQDGAEASSHKFLVLTNQTGVNSLDDLINANSVLL